VSWRGIRRRVTWNVISIEKNNAVKMAKTAGGEAASVTRENSRSSASGVYGRHAHNRRKKKKLLQA